MSTSDNDSLATLDARALDLRLGGRSFGAIAQLLGYERASQANDAFNRALRRRTPDEQVDIRDHEQLRLDAMAAQVRASEQLTAEEIDQRLATVERLRATLLRP
jgi:hypothetical protein